MSEETVYLLDKEQELAKQHDGFAFAVGDAVKIKHLPKLFVVQNRYPHKGFPCYDLLCWHDESDAVNYYQQLREDLLETV